MQIFEHSARFYDAIYTARKSYGDEAERLCAFIATARGNVPARTLLDVACGTGEHLTYLRQHFEVTGSDLSPFMLAEARRKLPDVPFHQMNMCELELDRSFDVVTCLFSAVGYLDGERDLRQAVQRMAAHLEPGGVLVIEPALAPDQVRPAQVSSVAVDVQGAHVTRLTSAEHLGGVLSVRFEYTVTDGAGERCFVEGHPMQLFRRETYMAALHDAGLEAASDETGLSGIGLFWGVRSRPATA